jgi:RHS repeat-associated protein
MPDRTLAEASTAKEDYTGHERDAETGLHYAGARYYMSALGRWTATEPLLDGNPRKLLEDGKGPFLSTSPYNYSLNNPTNLTDPDGECPICWDIADIGFAALSVRDAWNDPSASNIGWAAADVAAAALPIVPSTRGARLLARYGDDAVQAIKAGVGSSERVQDFAQAARALGTAANKAESVGGLMSVATGVEKVRDGLSVSLGTGSDASKIAKNLVGEGVNPVLYKDGNVLVFGGVQLGEESATVVVRTPKASSTGTNTVEVQLAEETIKFRTQELGSLFE